jgi:putative tricarboxylic transport membrane protein
VLKKVSETPEWAKYLADTSQSADYMSGTQLADFIKTNEASVTQVLKREGWLAN